MKVPGPVCYVERMFQEVKVLGSELASVVLELLLPGANWPGKALYPEGAYYLKSAMCLGLCCLSNHLLDTCEKENYKAYYGKIFCVMCAMCCVSVA